MSKSLITALLSALFAAALVWLSNYLSLPFWCCLLSSALFFTAPQSNLFGLLLTLLCAFLGIVFGVLYLQITPYIANFAYKMEVIVAVLVFVLFIITQSQYLKYFACSLITLSLLILQNGNWLVICQAVVLGIIFGFVAKSLTILLNGKSLN